MAEYFTESYPKAIPVDYPKAQAESSPQISLGDILGLQQPSLLESIASSLSTSPYAKAEIPSGLSSFGQLAYLSELSSSPFESFARNFASGLSTGLAMSRQRKYLDALKNIYNKGGYELGLDEGGSIVLKKKKTFEDILAESLPEMATKKYVTELLKTPAEREAEELANKLKRRQISQYGIRNYALSKKQSKPLIPDKNLYEMAEKGITQMEKAAGMWDENLDQPINPSLHYKRVLQYMNKLKSQISSGSPATNTTVPSKNTLLSSTKNDYSYLWK